MKQSTIALFVLLSLFSCGDDAESPVRWGVVERDPDRVVFTSVGDSATVRLLTLGGPTRVSLLSVPRGLAISGLERGQTFDEPLEFVIRLESEEDCDPNNDPDPTSAPYDCGTVRIYFYNGQDTWIYTRVERLFGI